MHFTCFGDIICNRKAIICRVEAKQMAGNGEAALSMQSVPTTNSARGMEKMKRHSKSCSSYQSSRWWCIAWSTAPYSFNFICRFFPHRVCCCLHNPQCAARVSFVFTSAHLLTHGNQCKRHASQLIASKFKRAQSFSSVANAQQKTNANYKIIAPIYLHLWNERAQ